MPITIAGLQYIANTTPPGPVPDTAKLPFDEVHLTLVDGAVIWELCHRGEVMTSRTMRVILAEGASIVLSGITGFSTVSIKLEG